MTTLSDVQLTEALEGLPTWTHGDGALHRSFTFADFSEAWGFMARVALVAETANHHPNWSNSWNRVDIAITSHDQGGITDACVRFALAVDALS